MNVRDYALGFAIGVAIGNAASSLLGWAARGAVWRFQSWRLRRKYGLGHGEGIGQIAGQGPLGAGKHFVGLKGLP
jgi:hypothetical protein